MRLEPIALGLLAALLTPAAGADCQLELELLGHDLRAARLTEMQKFDLAAWIDLALKHCRTGHEREAMEDLAKARRAVGIPKKDPLDELELDVPAPVK